MAILPKCGTRSYLLYYVLISIAYLQISDFLSSAEIRITVCETPECKQLDEYYKKIMKPNTGAACENFYDYVCHNQLDPTAISNIRKPLEKKLKNDSSETNKSALTRMILSAISAWKKQISESMWVNRSLKQAWIQFYDHFDNVEKTFTVEGIKLISNKTIGVSAGYLQWPIYDANLPPVIQYGALLSAVGRELYRGFNYTGFDGKLFDFGHSKNYQEQSKMLAEFINRIQCFINSYNDPKLIARLKSSMQKDADIPFIVNEVIPDVMGLKLAYRVYKDNFPILPRSRTPNRSFTAIIKDVFRGNPQQDGQIGNCTVLPGFEGGYGCDQLFFIAYASSLCVNSSPIPKGNAPLIGDQSRRVNFAVASMLQFQNAFGCDLYSKPLSRHLYQQCDLWR